VLLHKHHPSREVAHARIASHVLAKGRLARMHAFSLRGAILLRYQRRTATNSSFLLILEPKSFSSRARACCGGEVSRVTWQLDTVCHSCDVTQDPPTAAVHRVCIWTRMRPTGWQLVSKVCPCAVRVRQYLGRGKANVLHLDAHVNLVRSAIEWFSSLPARIYLEPPCSGKGMEFEPGMVRCSETCSSPCFRSCSRAGHRAQMTAHT